MMINHNYRIQGQGSCFSQDQSQAQEGDEEAKDLRDIR